MDPEKNMETEKRQDEVSGGEEKQNQDNKKSIKANTPLPKT